MLLVILAGAVTISITVAIHAGGTAWWIQRLRAPRAGRPRPSLAVLIETALFLILLHSLEVIVWALTYLWLSPGSLDSFGEALYFSFTTFTTLGYGDIVIEGKWRLLTGIESLNGILLLGWSTAISFAVIEKILNRAPDAPCP